MLSLIGIIWEHRHLFELRNVVSIFQMNSFLAILTQFGRDISKYAKTSAEYERGKDVFGRMKGHYGKFCHSVHNFYRDGTDKYTPRKKFWYT